MARYTVNHLARLSGVSVRTLHYYDEIGLLKPSDIGSNGYRYYDRPDLLQLQQILFYRELGMPLAEIKRTIEDPKFNVAQALSAHRRRLEADIARYHSLIRTIDDTLTELSGDPVMQAKMTNPFRGFTPEKQALYEKELVDQYGDYAARQIAESKQRVGKMSHQQMEALKREGDEVHLALVGCINSGDGPNSSKVQALVGRHYAWLCNYWTPDAQAYTALGQLYKDHPDFRSFYDKYDARLVDFLADAMKIYADEKLD